MQPVISAIVAGDEPALRQFLKSQLQQAWPALAIVAEAANGLDALHMIRTHQPHIV